MDVSINGSPIYFTIPVLGGIKITASLVNTWLVMAVLIALAWWLGRGLTVRNVSRKQVVAEYIVTTVQGFVDGNMGPKFSHFAPFIAGLFSLSALSSLISMVDLFSPTADLSTEVAWALLVFGMITFTKIRTSGVFGYLKGFTQPVPVLTPFNIISELATPVSMAFRHFGNIVSGSVINTLVYAALALASHGLLSLLLGWMPGAVGEVVRAIPFLQVGIPAVLSVYFDLFSSFMQAFIFCMLTMLYIASAAEED